MNYLGRIFIANIICVLSLSSCNTNPKIQDSNKFDSSKEDNYFVTSYYFPNYHEDARNTKIHGDKWTEWELVKEAKPRYKGHQQPKQPLWGFTDEADPKQMAQKIDAASDHGIDAFIFDWYYYEEGLFLERAIEEGFFGAKNNDRIQFALMWANHNWKNIHPADSASLKQEGGPELLFPGVITPQTWDKMTDYVIETYFKHSSYWLIEGAPYFSIYDLSKFIENFGSVAAAGKAVETFRDKVKKAGFINLHLNAVVWGQTILPGEKRLIVEDIDEFLDQVGFQSVTSYVWIHHTLLDFPTHDYNEAKNGYFKYANQITTITDLPYFPNVTMGWDSSPRANQDENFSNIGYPFMGSLINNTPENFKQALEEVKLYLDNHPESGGIFNINCWNEWTEGSYLEPDTINGMAYLEAVRDVFN